MKIIYRNRFTLVVGIAGVLLLAACTPQRNVPTSTATQVEVLTPYRSLTPTPTTLPSPQLTRTPPPTSTPTPTVTATPYLHVLKNEDTLFGLALFYGVSLEAIKTANPTVNPNFLTVGSSVIIPIQSTAAPTTVPTPTPVAVRLDAPRCYPTADKGLWCFVLATNEQTVALENLSAWVRLFSEEGQALQEQEAIPLLNRIASQASLPLISFFTPPVAENVAAYAELRNSLVVPISDTRYLTATVQGEVVDILPGGLQADVKGRVELVGSSLPAGVVWVAAVAYDVEGQIVGVRKWEAVKPLQPGEQLPFTLSVYSLGPAIARVDLVVEARP